MKKFVKFTVIFICLLSSPFLISQEIKTENYEVYLDQIFRSFANEMKEEFNFTCKGKGGSMPHDVESLEIDFIAYRRATIEEARELEVKTTERFLKIINSNEKIRPYLREYPFKSNRVQVAISFKNLDNIYYTDQSVAFVFTAKNKIFYCAKENDGKPFIDLAKESYDDAREIVQNNTSNPVSPRS